MKNLRIGADGNKMCVILGNNPQDGVSGYGDTLEEAIFSFAKDFHCTLCRASIDQSQRLDIETAYKTVETTTDISDSTDCAIGYSVESAGC